MADFSFPTAMLIVRRHISVCDMVVFTKIQILLACKIFQKNNAIIII